jgi:hypothetical protein
MHSREKDRDLIMDYPYEQLSPEKFQLFCQALLTKEYPSMQCMPVAQPDGGRDAIQWVFTGEKKEFVMFQVKFARQPLAVKDSHKWLQDIIADEAPKVKNQILNGATKFILMTNVSGTAHPETGSIDLIDALLTKELGIPSSCLWRNDLSRRLDNAWDLKWVYSELMTGPDLIRLIIEGGLSENGQRRTGAIRAFLTSQFAVEQEVKFKQVDLQNRLLDLFIDVPILPGHRLGWGAFGSEMFFENRYGGLAYDPFLNMREDDPFSDRPQFYRTRRVGGDGPGAATWLLGQATTLRSPFFVLEGAPGQGKSTITQYVCQVHRMRLLAKTEELRQIPDTHRSSPVRLPIKVDLRDFATWLSRRNPFTAEGEELASTNWNKSLEAFVAALIAHHSGGVIFDVADLHAVFRLSAVLIVLDGLDEVADIQRRSEVVAEIVKGVDRLKSIAASLQVVVTSRPAAFANSPGLPEKTYNYISLDSVTRELIEEYADKWLKARRLRERESSDVKKILREKLDQPHLRDLARNPMQLAILLSLIHTRGTSLPDKRTALYDSYVELFFNREAEKSNIVRDNRDLLIDIHRYLAWLLHTEAELSGSSPLLRQNGAIEEGRLKQVLRDYLKAEGHHDPGLLEKLFTGVVERVVALVSRVQGTYEFEVQPLREYFAARYLYETAPYSPVGNERRGTKPDRFDAIARNFYWLNVTRFYAGCYSKGELASLIDRLGELIRDPDFRYLSHPRVLAATLLSDWVFTQHPKSVSEVIRLVLDGLGLRFLLTSNSRRVSHSEPLILPSACGKEELVSRCFTLLRSYPSTDYALDIVDLIQANTIREEVSPLWVHEVSSVTEHSRTAWLLYGLHLGCLSTVSSDLLQNLLSDLPLTTERADLLMRGHRADVIQGSEQYFRIVLGSLLERRVTVVRTGGRLIEAFCQALNPERYVLGFDGAIQVPLVELWDRTRVRRNTQEAQSPEEDPKYPEAEKCRRIVDLSLQLAKQDAGSWANNLSNWDTLVSAIVNTFGTGTAAVELAVVASGIRSSSETCVDSPDLFDSSRPLCRRARYARLRAGTPPWWSRVFQMVSTKEDRLLSSLLWFTWASPSTVGHTVTLVDAIVASLSQEEWETLFDSLERTIKFARPQESSRKLMITQLKSVDELSHRTMALLWFRADPVLTWSFSSGRPVPETSDFRILKVLQAMAIRRLVRREGDLQEALNLLARSYAAGVLSPPYSSYSLVRHLDGLPEAIAAEIAANAQSYPSFLVAAAEKRCRDSTAQKVRPVSKAAEEEGWFQM